MSTIQSRIIRMSLVSCVLVGLLASGGIIPTAVQAAPAITSPPAPGATLSGVTSTFSWVAGGTAVEEWWLYVGTGGLNSRDIYDSGSLGTVLTDTVSGLPTDGSTVYVRLWWRIADYWSLVDETYVAFSGGGGGDNHTLRWEQSLPAAERFVLVLGGAAVLDKNTGLVWEQSPLTSTHSWVAARVECIQRGTGGLMGWRLPSISELASLVVPGNPAGGGPDLPAGHPFSNVQVPQYWSATTDVVTPANAWRVSFFSGSVAPDDKGDLLFAWCVRGGGPLSEY